MSPETQQRLAEIEERESKATGGEWYWSGVADHKIVNLTSTVNGHETVMDFTRWGLNSAAPRFKMADGYMERIDIGEMIVPRQKHRPDGQFYEINHPNADFIANSRDDVRWLLQLVREQQKEIESHGPEGRNYTNLQYVTLLQENQLLQSEKQRLEREVERLKAALVPGGWSSIGPLQLMECEDCHTEFMVLSCEEREEASCPSCLGDRIGFGESYAMIPRTLWPGSAAELYQQENERLRRALETIADASFYEDLPSVVYKTARKALAERSETP